MIRIDLDALRQWNKANKAASDMYRRQGGLPCREVRFVACLICRRGRTDNASEVCDKCATRRDAGNDAGPGDSCGMRDNGDTTKDGPAGALTPVVPGLTDKEIG